MRPTVIPSILAVSRHAQGVFDFAADALDLADRLQTPILVLSDLELGMNENLSDPLEWMTVGVTTAVRSFLPNSWMVLRLWPLS